MKQRNISYVNKWNLNFVKMNKQISDSKVTHDYMFLYLIIYMYMTEHLSYFNIEFKGHVMHVA